MPPRSCTPGAHAVVRADKVVAREHRIVAIRVAQDQLSINVGLTAVSTSVMCAKGVAE